MKPQSLEQILSTAAGGGWNWFEQVDPEIAKAVDVQQQRDTEDAHAIARAWADFADRPEGRKALERLFDTTLRRTVFFASLGLDINSMAVFGAFREGQNSLAHEIARQIAIGQGDNLKTRETL